MTIKIDQKIVDYSVTQDEKPESEIVSDTGDGIAGASATVANADSGMDGQRVPSQRVKAEVIQMHEKLERPDTLIGSTYKVKTPLSDHALYVTINDVVLNLGTEHEQRRPFEIFINSKNMEHFQWIVALTLIMSAVFRKGGDVTFIVEELRSVFDPKGGYFKKGGKYMPSLVAEIGDAIECHLRMIGLLKDEPLDAHQQELIAAKRAQINAIVASSQAPAPLAGEPASTSVANNEETSFPSVAVLCGQCQTKAVVNLDGCMTCLNCGDSKCG